MSAAEKTDEQYAVEIKAAVDCYDIGTARRLIKEQAERKFKDCKPIDINNMQHSSR